MTKPPILTDAERVRVAKQAAGRWQSHYRDRSHEVQEKQQLLDASTSELRELRQRFAHEMEAERERHASELEQYQEEHDEKIAIVRAQERARMAQHVEAVKQWGRIQQQQSQMQHDSAMDQQQQRHDRELAARAARSETWRKKRHNQLRSWARDRAGRKSLQNKAKEKEAELRELAADNDALHAEVGSRIKVQLCRFESESCVLQMHPVPHSISLLLLAGRRSACWRWQSGCVHVQNRAARFVRAPMCAECRGAPHPRAHGSVFINDCRRRPGFEVGVWESILCASLGEDGGDSLPHH